MRAGKLRRYHGEGLRQLLDIPTLLKNARDLVYVAVGFVQSLLLLRRLRPNVLFIKGGFVGVPVGLAAAVLRIPYVTHDSDAIPGLANRIVAPWARWHAVALPKNVYNYPSNKTLTVGVPVAHNFRLESAAEKKHLRVQLGLPVSGEIVLVTGGGLGAQFINSAVASCIVQLLDRYPKLSIVLITGRAHESNMRQHLKKILNEPQLKRVVVKGFVTNLYQYSAVASVVIARAGGTSLAELAAQAKPCIIIPNPLLAGGHQLKNAQVLADNKAVRLLSEEKLRADYGALMPPLVDLLDNPTVAVTLGKQLHKMAQTDAAERLAVLLLEVADQRS